MASSNRQVPAALLMILMLFLTQSPRTTEAISKCEIACLLKCAGGTPVTYAVCAAECLLSPCKEQPLTPEDKVMHCKTGCIMTLCSGPNQGPNDDKTKGCIRSCSDGCEVA